MIMANPDENGIVEPEQGGEGLPWEELGETTAALAAMGQFSPQADLPNLGPSREVGRL